MDYPSYHDLPGVRASRLKLMGESPLHYAEHVDKDTAARGMLRAIHTAVLEPAEHFDRDFAMFDGARRGKLFDAFVACHPGTTILNVRAAAEVVAIGDGILRHQVAHDLLRQQPGESEKTLQWTDPATGLDCKARLDRYIEDGTTLDLKGYGTSNPRLIDRLIERRGAHIQAAHYVSGLEALGLPFRRYLLIVYEIKPPYDVAVVALTDALQVGRVVRAGLMNRLSACLADGKWPGRCPDIVECELSDWTIPEIEVSDERE